MVRGGPSCLPMRCFVFVFVLFLFLFVFCSFSSFVLFFCSFFCFLIWIFRFFLVLSSKDTRAKQEGPMVEGLSDVLERRWRAVDLFLYQRLVQAGRWLEVTKITGR